MHVMMAPTVRTNVLLLLFALSVHGACPPGQYQDHSVCQDCNCAGGYYSDAVDAIACNGMSPSCKAAGRAYYAPGGAAQRNVCTCDPGYTSVATASSTCDGTSPSCYPCGEGFFCAGGGGQPQVCECARGYVSESATSSSCAGTGGTCTLCPEGYYCPGGGSNKYGCRTCASGEGVAVACNATHDAVCGPCSSTYPGTFSDANDANPCSNCTECGPGLQAAADCTPTSDRICTACDIGYYKDGYGNACTACPALHTTTTVGAVNLSECVCLPGFEGPGGGTCAPCAADFYKDVLGPGPCFPCPANATTGGASGSANVTDCTCLPGFEGEDGEECNECARGRYEDTSRNVCVDCGPGNDTPSSGSVEGACEPCEDDLYSAGPRGPCIPCPPYQTTEGTDRTYCTCAAGAQPDFAGGCVPCPQGFFKTTVGPSLCSACDSGNSETTAREGATSPSECQCAPGFTANPEVSAGTNGIACMRCPVGVVLDDSEVQGTYKDWVGNEACLSCPNGSTYYALDGFASSTDVCDRCIPMHYGQHCLECPECDHGTCFDSHLGDGTCKCRPDAGWILPLCDICVGREWFGPGCNQTTTCRNGEANSGLTGDGECSRCNSHVFVMPNCNRCTAGYAPYSLGCNGCDLGYGSVSRDDGALGCEMCSPGSFSGGVTGRQCDTCPPGSAQPLPGQTECNGCLVGQYQDEAGQTACKDCGPGKTTDGEGSTSAGDCTDCPLHFYNSNTSGTCVPCGRGRLTENPGQVSDDDCGCNAGFFSGPQECEPCPRGATKLFFGDDACVPCSVGTYFVGADQPCEPCPIGGVCRGGAQEPIPQEGWTFPDSYDPTSGAYNFVQCDPPSVCRLGGTCLTGHTGTRCAQCETEWYKDVRSGICFKCPDHVAIILLALFVLACIGCLCMVYFARKKTIYFAAIQVGFNFMQIIAVLSSFSVAFPKWLANFLNVMSAVNFDLQLFRPECMVEDSREAYTSIWFLKIFLPAIFISLLVLIYGCLRLYDWVQSNVLPSLRVIPQQELVTLKRSFINSGLTVTSVLYLVVSSTALEIWPCKSLEDGSSVMVREPLITCYEGRWNTFAAVSFFVLLLYSFGFPATVAFILYKRRFNLWKRKNALRYGLLFLRFQPHLYLFEVTVLARKFVIIFGRTIFAKNPLMQVIMAMGAVGMSLLAQFTISPYRAGRMNRLEQTHLVSGFAILLLALVFAATQLDEVYARDTPDNLQLSNATAAGDDDELRAAAEVDQADYVGVSHVAADVLAAFIVVIVLCNVLFVFGAIFFEMLFQRKLTDRGIPDELVNRIDVSDYFFAVDMAVDNFKETAAEVVDEDGNTVTGTAFSMRISTVPGVRMKGQVVCRNTFPKARPPAKDLPRDAFRSLRRTMKSPPPARVTPLKVEDVEDGAVHLVSGAMADSGNYTVELYADGNDVVKRRNRDGLLGAWRKCGDGLKSAEWYHATLAADVASETLRRTLAITFIVAPVWASEAEVTGPGKDRGLEGADQGALVESKVPTCEMCDQLAGATYCDECQLVYCLECDEKRHRKGAFVRHIRAPLAAASDVDAKDAQCEFCAAAPATVHCSECEMIYCDSCALRRHRKGPNRRHTPMAIDRAQPSRSAADGVDGEGVELSSIATALVD